MTSEAPAERSLLEEVAAFVAGTPIEAIPPMALHQAKLCTLDTVGCMLAGVGLPGVAAMVDVERDYGGRPEASVVGHALRLPAEAAARINGYLGDILELNDNTGGHASIAVVSCVAALAESLGARGVDALRAIALGIEVVCRVHAGYYERIKPFTEAGLSPTGVPNAVGCAAAAAVLLDLDAAATARALAIGATLASWSPAEAFFGDGGTIKPVLFGGWPAANGMRAARSARRGLTGPRSVLESPIGYYATVSRGFDAARVTAPEAWQIETPRRKRHACCGYMHSALDALAAMRHEQALPIDRARIEIRMPANVIDAVSKKGRLPVSDNDARFNLEYCAAVVACGDDVILPMHSTHLDAQLARADIRSMVPRVRVVADSAKTHYEQSEVHLLEAGVPTRVRRGSPALGAPSNPMSDAQVIAKFAALAGPEAGSRGVDDYVQRVLAMESQADAAWIVGTFARRA